MSRREAGGYEIETSLNSVIAQRAHGSAGPVEATALAFAFLCLAGVALAIRDPGLVAMMTGVSSRRLMSFGETSLLCNDLPACFRVGGTWLQVAIDALLYGLADLFRLLPDRHRPEIISLDVKYAYLGAFSVVAERILVLTPILIVAIAAFRNFLPRLLFLFAVFFAISGWARRNPLFSEQSFASYDYAAIGFLFGLYLLMVRGTMSSLAAAGLILVVGQLFFEHLGFITGVAVAIYTYVLGASLRDAGKKLIALGVVSIATVAVVYGSMMAKFGDVYWVQQGKTFGYTFEFYGRVNFAEGRDIVENALMLLAYPILSGIILGLLASFVTDRHRAPKVLRAEFWAAAAIWFAFLGATAIGMFTSGLYYEMGRQLVPLACVTILATAKGISLIAVRYRSD